MLRQRSLKVGALVLGFVLLGAMVSFVGAKDRNDPNDPFDAPVPQEKQADHANSFIGPKASEQMIRHALEETTDFEFIETSLEQVAVYIRDRHGIEIVFREKALADAGFGVPSEITITKNLRGITLRSALKLTLADLDLAWIIRDEVLQVTTQEEVKSDRETRLYQVHDLVVSDEDEKGEPDFDPLIRVITTGVEPESWGACCGPPRGIASFCKNGVCALVISQSFAAHEEIDKLLADLRKLKSQ